MENTHRRPSGKSPKKRRFRGNQIMKKIECVGHVQKRMGTRLRKLILVYSKKKLSDGKTIGGKGRLTDSLIDKLAHYYGNAIRCNSTSVKEMRKAIWAVFGVILAALIMNRCTGFVLQIQIHGCRQIRMPFPLYKSSNFSEFKISSVPNPAELVFFIIPDLAMGIDIAPNNSFTGNSQEPKVKFGVTRMGNLTSRVVGKYDAEYEETVQRTIAERGSACGREFHFACMRSQVSSFEVVGHGSRTRHRPAKSHTCSVGNITCDKQDKEGIASVGLNRSIEQSLQHVDVHYPAER
ncbi:uncharacterized protein TNCV_3199101 [Trichonephila clavipes]|nr:uncharacterized protein TNCV_3199101 [Trichonephila clavipes]